MPTAKKTTAPKPEAEEEKPVTESNRHKYSQPLTAEEVGRFVAENMLYIVVAVGVLGIWRNNRKTLKFLKKVVKAAEETQLNYQTAISSMRIAGQDFTYYPGVGLYINR